MASRKRRSEKPLPRNSCVVNKEGVEVCPVNDEDEGGKNEVSYEGRKKQVRGNDDGYMIGEGIEYDGSSPLIVDLFDESRISQKVHTETGIENVRRSYIYIISKKIDGRTFIKIGISRMSNQASTSTRLGFIQTVLIPGLENIGFKLHYLFFYTRESKEKTSTFAESIEKDLHKVLQNHKSFRQTVIKFPTNNASEWYLPDSGKYREFLEYVLRFISAQRPEPEEAYHFYIRYGKEKRESKGEFLEKVTEEEVVEFRKDYRRMKEEIIAKNKLTSQENDLRKGSKGYYKKKLLRKDLEESPLGSDILVQGIYYHKTRSDNLRIHGNYYVELKNTENDSKPDIFVDFSEEKDGNIRYYSSIYNVLKKMDEIGTLEMYGLETNYNHYDKEPIEKAEVLLRKIDVDTKVKLRSSEISWIIGRYMEDKNRNKYKAIDFSIDGRNKNKVKGIKCVRLNEVFRETEDIVVVDPLIAISLAIDYHSGRVSRYEIDDKYDEKEEIMETKYKVFDFIKFHINYFYDEDTKKYLKERYIGIIVEIYNQTDEESGKNMQFYDILFENEIWKLDTSSVDKHSDKVIVEKEKKSFINKVTKNRNLISKVIKELGMEVRKEKIKTKKVVVRKTKRSTRSRPLVTRSSVYSPSGRSGISATKKSKSSVLVPRRSTRKKRASI